MTAATQDILYTYNIAATDQDAGDMLTITSAPLPGWLTLTDNGDGTATLSGTPTNADVGNNVVGLLVTDSGSLTDAQSFTISVTNVNDPPVAVGSIATQTGTEGTAFGPLDVTTNFNDPDGDTLTYSLSGLPAGTGLAIDSGTGVISGTPTDADAKASQPITVTVSATDGSTPATQPFDLTVTDINNAPVFTSIERGPARPRMWLFTFDVTATDPDAGDTLTITSGALPGWLTLTDNGNGTATLSGTPTNADVASGSVNVDLTVTDSGVGNRTATQSLTINLTNVNDPPAPTAPPIATNETPTAPARSRRTTRMPETALPTPSPPRGPTAPPRYPPPAW